MISFGNLELDRPKYAANVTPLVINCKPIADGWGPLADITPVSAPLPSACRGAFYVRTSTGAYRIFAGTATKLYEYNSTTRAWTDVSTGSYSVPVGDRWWFVAFGAKLICGNLADNPQFIDIDAGTKFANLPGTPPRARYAWMAGAQLVLGHLASFPNRVMTSGIGDAEWWTPGRRGCDFQDFPDGEEVCGGIGAQGGAIIFQRTKIRSMTMLSGEIPFRTDVLNPARGVVAPQSIAQTGPGQFVYLSLDGFFANVEGRAIGLERVDRWFFEQIDRSKLHEVRAMVDPITKIVWWHAQRNNGSTMMLGYCWPLDRWCYSDATFTEMAALVTTGITIDGLDAYYATIDDVKEPYDSVIFTGGIPTMSVFDAENRLCYMAGTAMKATLQTPDTQLVQGARAFLSKVRAITDAPTFTIATVTSDFHGGSRTVGSPVSPYAATGICHFRASALMHGFHVEIPAGQAWTHVMGIDFPDGAFRRAGQR